MSADRSRPWRPDWAVAPGEILTEALAERGMTQVELARRMARPLKTVNEIVKGKAAITPETALQLEFTLGISARFWLDLEREFGEQKARQESRTALVGSTDWVKRFPLRDLMSRTLIPKTRSPVEQLEGLLRFFGVTSPAAWQRQWETVAASFRRPAKLKSRPESIAAWLRAGRLRAQEAKVEPFDTGKLEAALPQLRGLTPLQPIAFEDRLIRILRECGVVLVLVAEFEGTHLYGASYWAAPDRAVIQLSLRQRKDDEFWFSLFHEIDHILRGSRRGYYVHDEGADSADVDEERRADEFARRQLIPDGQFSGFVTGHDFSDAAIVAFARSIGVGAGIVVGRLQREDKLPRSHGDSLKKTIRFHDGP